MHNARAPISPSLPGLTRQSILIARALCEDDGPAGQALRDSHISQGPSMLDGLESNEPMEDDHRSWFSIVAGPSAQASEDPGSECERAFGVGIFLPRSFAFEVRRDVFESW